MTPTFQVDDLHCIVGARARDGPHLDSGSPFLSSRPSSLPGRRRPTDSHRRTLAGMQQAAAAAAATEARWRGSRTDPTVACHYLRLKIVWLVTVNFGGREGWRSRVAEYFDCIVAVFLPFFLFSRFHRKGRGTREIVHAVFFIEQHEIMDELIAILLRTLGMGGGGGLKLSTRSSVLQEQSFYF